MVKALLSTAALLALWGASPAMATAHRHHHHHGWHHRHHNHHHHYHRAHRGPYTIGYGETIISGRTGLHRDGMTMVPDSAAPSDVWSGRRRGSGLGANGLPGSNLDE